MQQEMKKSKVLIVDDTPENIQVLMGTLKDRYAIVAAVNGEKALRMAVATPQPDLILLDIMMPEMDGFEVCRQLKADPATHDIPVIFLSALTDTSNKVKGFAEGAVDYISKPFQPEEVLVRVSTHLTMNRLNREIQYQRDQLENELKVVSKLQCGLLPDRLPDTAAVKLAVHYETSRFAGGDYYDVVEMENGCYGFMMADAEGHSAPAAVMMAMTCALFRSCPELHSQPDKVIDFINRKLCNVNKESFVTALYAVYDAQNRKIRIARAGHPLPIIFRPAEGKARLMDCEGVFMMGVLPYGHVPVTEFSLEPNDRLLLYTDGITERFDVNNKIYGEDRLCRMMEQPGIDSQQTILDSILHDVQTFAGERPADDDQTMLLIMPA